MNSYCGLDFGTSNSTIGIVPQQQSQLVILQDNKPTMRSAIFCDAEAKEWVFGQEGIDRYLESTPGRLMMALKSVLGSTLMEDETLILNEFISYKKILGRFVQHVKQKAEAALDKELTQVVMGRPVHFHDTDAEKDRYAQDTLESIAREVGFKEILFQYEPIAAALTYEMSIQSEQVALIIDMGGGTSDFTVIRLKPNTKTVDRSQDVLANTGIHIAGTDFDQRLSLDAVMPLLGMGTEMQGSSSFIEIPSAYYHDLTTWHTLSTLYNANTLSSIRSIQNRAKEKQLIGRLLYVLQTRAGHHILDAVETGKQALSQQADYLLNLDFIESALHAAITQQRFNQVIDHHLQSILATVLETITLANIKTTDVHAIFYTGGSTKIPIIRNMINAHFPNATVIQGDAFGSVGLGLTIDAQRRYG